MLLIIKKIAEFFGFIKTVEDPEEKLKKIEQELNELNVQIYYENQKKIDEMYKGINDYAKNLK